MSDLIDPGRAIVHRQAEGTFDSGTCRTDGGHWHGKLSARLRSVGSRLRAFSRTIRHRVYRAAIRHLPWMRAMRNAEVVRAQRRAKRRALCLLMRLLNPEQRREFREHRHFHVTGASSGNRYRIQMEAVANIYVLDDDGNEAKHRLCVHPAGGVPLYDVMASQLLQLQDPVAERRLLQQANIVPPPPGSRLYCELAMLP